jgi:hypothetical protein
MGASFERWKDGGARSRWRGLLRGPLLCAAAACITACEGAATSSSAPPEPRDAIVVDAARTAGRYRPIWDEVNLWKLDSWFGIHRPDPAETLGDGWLRDHAPWFRYARVAAALGGNYAPEIADACDHGRSSPEHPDVVLWECGRDGRPGVAAQNELARFAGGRWTFDYAPFRTAVERVLRSGVRPHLNLSSSPSAFTGGTTDFLHYHWNAAPVTDVAGWVDFVRGAFRSISDLGPAGWRVSIINEPNCLTIDAGGVIRNVGFSAGPERYARLWTATARAIREVAPGVVLHPGNYVTSATFPGEDNLHEYLTALAAELGGSQALRWSDLPYVSLSLYEVPDTELFDFRSTRLARLETAQRRSGLAPLAVKIDELGIHPDVRKPFEERAKQPLRPTLFAASWHAEALRSFLETGDVASAAPWLDDLFKMPTFQVLPTGQVYRLLGVLVGQLGAGGADGAAPSFEPIGDDRGRDGLAVRSPDDRATSPRSTLRGLATAGDSGDTIRVLVVHHQNEPVVDGDATRQRLAREVDVRLGGLRSGAWMTRHLNVGGEGGSRWEGERSTPLAWRDDGCTESDGGELVAASAVPMPANSVWLFDVTRHERCPTS